MKPFIYRGDKEVILEFNSEGVCITPLKKNDSIFFKCSVCERETSKKVLSFRRKGQEISLESLSLCGFCLGKKTNLEKYGVENPFQSEEIKEKIKKTNLKKYGVENPSQSEEIKEKIKKINLEKYGVEFYTQSEEAKNKTKETFLEKYGVENISQLDEIKEKKRNAYLERYGVDNPLRSEEIMDRLKQTNLEKYGVENVSQADFVKKKKQKKTNAQGLKTVERMLKEVNVEFLDKKKYRGQRDSIKNRNIEYDFVCLTCGNVFKDNVHARAPRCFVCYPVQKSIVEKEIFDFIESLGVNPVSGDRDIIAPLELDIVVPDKKFAVEVDGLYWHSAQMGKDKNYHLDKTIKANEAGYSLIHIFEDEWANKREIVESIIKARLGIFDRRIFARKCEVREIEKEESILFFDKNHLQGSIQSSVNIGLFFDDELVSCISFAKSRYNKNYDWEIMRFSNALNTAVVGGFSKLLNYFTKNYTGDIITYSNRRLFDGGVYRNNGFNELTPSAPNYFYFYGGNVLERFSRVKFQKHKLKDLLEEFDKDLTEKENMEKNGYKWIYDCGNWVFELRRNNGL